MGPVLLRRLEARRSALRRLPHLPTYDCRERALSMLVILLVLHGVAIACRKMSLISALDILVKSCKF